MSLNLLKAINPNSIPTKVLKLLINDISSYLTDFLDLSYSCGVLLIYKKDSELKHSNKKPIFLLSNIDKELERLLCNRQYSFLKMNSVIYDFQFGFTQKHSTSHALIHLTDKMREQLGSGNFARGIFIDLQDILIQKLNHCGIRGVANDWFSSNL